MKGGSGGPGRVFLTGGSGMLGANIVRVLLQEGYSVTCLVHPEADDSTLEGLSVRILKGDLLDASCYRSALREADAVIHSAASTAVWPQRNPVVMRTNLDGTRTLMRASMEAGMGRFVHIGTASSFQPGSPEFPGTEESPYGGRAKGSDYLDSKWMAQTMLLEEHSRSGFPVVIVCPTFMIGAFDSGQGSGKLVLQAARGKLPFYSRGGKNFVHARDVAVAAVNALEMGRTGQCYIAGGRNLSYEAFFRIVFSRMGLPFRMRRVPFALVLGWGACQSAWSLLTGSRPALSLWMARVSGESQYYDPAKSVSELAMPQTPIDMAVQDCLDWFRRTGRLAGQPSL